MSSLFLFFSSIDLYATEDDDETKNRNNTVLNEESNKVPFKPQVENIKGRDKGGERRKRSEIIFCFFVFPMYMIIFIEVCFK